ncbi:ACP S-malonyltransferase [Anoxynatronum buryatiense]|uniref:[acyl-carrier-protein] S-malonyltransferase n=1 Tax=Anoxynatronum buryatiense TaxID=489973 RepID=A0AA45WXX6_9CLOT|nr:ACP S-malonyltransferase [Anoxynatronum buryatiense]SMP66548.1 [acyl-carrier-protein] S-malonyltransferase [Anoxynatronum buryatiense]
MTHLAFIFPGQGAQYVGMGKDFYQQHPLARETFQEAEEALGIPLARLCHEGPESELTRTEITQPAILTTSVAMLRTLTALGFQSTMTAGLSLGEYTALVHAGSLAFADAVRLVKYRGKYMQEAVPEDKGGMAAILGLDPEALEDCLSAGRRVGFVAVANFNCPGQIVLSGETAAVKRAMEACKEAGAKKAVMLTVSAPFHTPMLDSAGERLKINLASITLQAPNQLFFSNVTGGDMADTTEIAAALVKQVSHPVLWEKNLLNMMHTGCNTFVEIGPSNSLTGFVKRTAKTHGLKASGMHIETYDQLNTVAETLTKEGYHGIVQSSGADHRSLPGHRPGHCPEDGSIWRTDRDQLCPAGELGA